MHRKDRHIAAQMNPTSICGGDEHLPLVVIERSHKLRISGLIKLTRDVIEEQNRWGLMVPLDEAEL